MLLWAASPRPPPWSPSPATRSPPEDIKSDVGAASLPNARFVETGTVWGHFTVINLREQDTAAIDAIYGEVLST